jgi:hypothetical protein
VAFASWDDDVACWSASLTLSGAAQLADDASLFYVSPVPAAAKLAPALLRGAAAAAATFPEAGRESEAAAAPGAVARAVLRSRGLVVRLAPTAASGGHNRSSSDGATAERAATLQAALASKWTAARFGLAAAGAEHGDALAAWFPVAEDHEVAGLVPLGEATAARHGHPAWRAARRTAAADDCAGLLAVAAPASVASTGTLRLSLQRLQRRSSSRKKRSRRTEGEAEGGAEGGEGDEDDEAPSAEEEACALAVVAYLAAQPEVLSVDASRPPTANEQRVCKRVAYECSAAAELLEGWGYALSTAATRRLAASTDALGGSTVNGEKLAASVLQTWEIVHSAGAAAANVT